MRPRLAAATAVFVSVAALAPPGGAQPVPRPGGIPLEVKQTRHCSVLAPADWSFRTDPQGSTAAATSPDRTMHAGWALVTIERAGSSADGEAATAPEASIRFLASQVLAGVTGDTSAVRYTTGAQFFLGAFTLRDFESGGHVGLAFYRIYPGATAETFVESVYFAIATKAKSRTRLMTAAGVAVSLRCLTGLPQRSGTPPGTASTGRIGCGTGGTLRNYQRELGGQFAHSRATGQVFLVDPGRDWNNTGPQGPGYYRAAGKGYERLEPGRPDDC